MVHKQARVEQKLSEEQQKFSQSSPHVAGDEPGSEAEATRVIAEVVEELSDEEISDRHRLELKVEKGLEKAEQTFYEMGVALRELRERRLYRSTHRNFGDYCRERFRHIKRRQAEYLILASEVVDDLRTAHNCARFPLPSSESQVRAMKSLDTQQRIEVWQTGVAESSGKVPTAKTIKTIVDRLKEKPLPKFFLSYKRNDPFILQGLTGAERRYNGCWAIAREVLEFSLIVETHDGSLQVRPDNLEPIDDRAVRRQLTTLLKRIKQLRKCELDRGAEVVLESLGKQLYLTELEKKLLELLENHYGVI